MDCWASAQTAKNIHGKMVGILPSFLRRRVAFIGFLIIILGVQTKHRNSSRERIIFTAVYHFSTNFLHTEKVQFKFADDIAIIIQGFGCDDVAKELNDSCKIVEG